jgi:hypothetical protein
MKHANKDGSWSTRAPTKITYFLVVKEQAADHAANQKSVT